MQNIPGFLGVSAPVSWLALGFLLAVATNHLALSAGGRRKSGDLPLFFLAIIMSLRFALTGGCLDWLTPVSSPVFLRLDVLPAFLLLPVYAQFVHSLFPQELGASLVKSAASAGALWLAAALLLPLRAVPFLAAAFLPVAVAGIAAVFIALFRARRGRRSATKQIQVGTAFFGVFLFMDILGTTGWVPIGREYLALVCVGIYASCSAGLGRRNQDSFDAAARASLSLARQNEELESLVGERTRELVEANEGFRKMAETDGLTGIANRRKFEAVLAEERSRAGRSGSTLSVGMFDVDYFKAYNDTYGHKEGDACLRRIAATLESHARRPADLAARYGGEEFALLLPDTDARGALAMVRAAADGIRRLGIAHESSPFRVVTISAGVASSVMGQDDIVLAADRALYAAKAAGRDTVRSAT